MPFQPASTLRSRTFIGLLVAQFLAAFNDQAIHASAMFFAINQKSMTAANAITLMPVLFYAPWAIFCTLAGYLADRFSKRDSLVFWKVAEIGITLIALVGFWLGSVQHNPLGPWIVLSTVFLMGTHSAFFVPAKYGAMPEILRHHLLSRGNGLLESLSFLAVILGTVSGGVLSFLFAGHEYLIGVLLVTLALVGAGASLLIQRMPAANPTRPFPKNLFRPLVDNLRTLFASRPLALAVLGIAFFTFMVAFMRATMYMHGETRNPPWDEFHTSLVVGVVALGIGLGSPLAGFLSGGKTELGLVPLGAVGMIVCLLLAALVLNLEPGLIACLVGIGFFTGFYIVPLFTLLQHRAPKASKGDLLASSNFINVVGAITASLLFKALVVVAGLVGIIQAVQPTEATRGQLVQLKYEQGRPAAVEVVRPYLCPSIVGLLGSPQGDGGILAASALCPGRPDRPLFHRENRQVRSEEEGEQVDRVRLEKEGNIDEGDEVIVARYQLVRAGHKVTYFRVQPADRPVGPAYDEQGLPSYLFLGAGLMTLGILVLLCRQLPDFLLRSLVWLHARGRYRLKVVGMHNLPTNGPVILATNCDRFEDCLLVLASTDRYTRFILLERERNGSGLLGSLARRTEVTALAPDTSTPEAWDRALERAARSLDRGNLVGLTADGEASAQQAERLLQDLRARAPALVVPVYCGTLPSEDGSANGAQPVRVVIGQPARSEATPEEIRQTIRLLGEWIRQTEQEGIVPLTAKIPAAVAASPTGPGSGPPPHP
jgi:MFS family permease